MCVCVSGPVWWLRWLIKFHRFLDLSTLVSWHTTMLIVTTAPIYKIVTFRVLKVAAVYLLRLMLMLVLLLSFTVVHSFFSLFCSFCCCVVCIRQMCKLNLCNNWSYFVTLPIEYKIWIFIIIIKWPQLFWLHSNHSWGFKRNIYEEHHWYENLCVQYNIETWISVYVNRELCHGLWQWTKMNSKTMR